MLHWKTGKVALLAAAALAGCSAASIVAATRALAQNTVKLELWSRQDPSGPLRAGNVVKAAERLNKELAAESSAKRVQVVVRESPAPGFDDDALQLLKVFGIGQGPDTFIVAHEWICAFQAYGNGFVDPKTGHLLLERDKLAAAFGWFARAVKEGVIPANNTAMEFDALRKQFYTGNAVFWMYGIWDLGTYAFPTYGLPSDEAKFFADWGWIAAPPPKRGGAPGSLTHPIIYAVAARAADPELAVRLLGHASAADLNADHAVATTHL